MRPSPCLLALLLGCPSPPVGPEPTPAPPEPVEDWSGRVEHVALRVDVADKTASATIAVAGAGDSFSLEAGGLIVQAVAADQALPFEHRDGRLDVALPEGVDSFTVDYSYADAARFQGWMETGSSVTWPTHCGNLFPCRSDPALGSTYELDIEGAAAAASIPFPAPAYQVAWAVGDYTRLELGPSDGGVALVAFHKPDSAEAAAAGTAELPAIFSWYEATFGDYPYGEEAGPVEVDWGPGYGGIEHHPLWHVSTPAFGDVAVHAHEVAHAWFGDGVRIACWEDLVLSEGTAQYLQARSIGRVLGDVAEFEQWEEFEGRMGGFGGVGTRVAWVEGSCNDPEALELVSATRAPYYKGALFYRNVAREVGEDAFDAVLASFHATHAGQAASFAQMLEHIEGETGFDPRPLAEAWLFDSWPGASR